MQLMTSCPGRLSFMQPGNVTLCLEFFITQESPGFFSSGSSNPISKVFVVLHLDLSLPTPKYYHYIYQRAFQPFYYTGAATGIGLLPGLRIY